MNNTFAGNTYYGRTVATATIASGASVSATVDLSNAVLTGIIMPAAWTAADLTVEVSHDGTAWIGLAYDATATQCNNITTPAVDTAHAFDVRAMAPYQYIRLRSGTTASPVNQGADRDVLVISRLIS